MAEADAGYAFGERAGILQFDAGLARADAEARATGELEDLAILDFLRRRASA
jgi:hypothetical protein